MPRCYRPLCLDTVDLPVLKDVLQEMEPWSFADEDKKSLGKKSSLDDSTTILGRPVQKWTETRLKPSTPHRQMSNLRTAIIIQQHNIDGY